MSSTPQLTAVIGASGRVASRVIPLLADEFSLKLGDLRGSNGSFPLVHSVDLLKPETLAAFLAGADAVIHFAIASYDDVEQSDAHREAYHQQMLKVNVAGTYNLLEAAKSCGVKKIIYISSLTVAMGANSDFAETLPPCPIDVYACTKLFSENMTELYSRNLGISGTSLRLGHPFPLGLPQQEALRRNSDYASSFVTIPDITRAIQAALTTDRKGYGVYNVVSPSRESRISYQKGLDIGFQPQDRWQENPELA